MSATFVLAAMDPPGSRAGRRFLAAGLERRGPTRGGAVVVGAAHGDDAKRLRQMTRDLEAALGGERVVAPRLTDPGLDVAAAAKAIEGASVLYLDGGDTLVLVRAVVARGLERAFATAAAGTTLIYGLSAGACAASAFTIGHDDEGASFVAPCLDLGVPWPVDVHDEGDDWPEMRALLELRPVQGLVIPSGAAVIVQGEAARALTGGPELRSLDPRGGWKVSPL